MNDLIKTAKELIEKAEKATPGERFIDKNGGIFTKLEECFNNEGASIGFNYSGLVLYGHPIRGKCDVALAAACDPATITALCRLLLEYHEIILEVRNRLSEYDYIDENGNSEDQLYARVEKALAAAGKGGVE